MTRIIARRTALTAGAVGAGAVAFAACSSSSSSTPAATTTSAHSAPGQKQRVAALADIKVGEAIAAKIGGQDVLVARPTESTVVCFSARCTHEGCKVNPAGKQLNCPCHNASFNAKTGAVMSGPPPRPLDRIAVSVDNGEVVAT